jgi:hypothetical protein
MDSSPPPEQHQQQPQQSVSTASRLLNSLSVASLSGAISASAAAYADGSNDPELALLRRLRAAPSDEFSRVLERFATLLLLGEEDKRRTSGDGSQSGDGDTLGPVKLLPLRDHWPRGPQNRRALVRLASAERLDDLSRGAKIALLRALTDFSSTAGTGSPSTSGSASRPASKPKHGRAIARLWYSLPPEERQPAPESEVDGLTRAECALFARRARHAGALDLDPFPVELWGSVDASCLADDDVSRLPALVRERGEAAIDRLAAAALDEFPDRGVGLSCAACPELDGIVQLFELSDLVDRIGFESSCGADVAAFVKLMADNAKLNPVLLATGAAFETLSAAEQASLTPDESPTRARNVRRGIAMSIFHHAICSAVFHEPKKCDLPGNAGKPEAEWTERMLMEEIVARFQAERSKPEFTSVLDAFERVKMTGVDYCVDGMLHRKAGDERGRQEFQDFLRGDSGAMVGVNILEAMFCDTQLGFEDNAECGFELMVEPPNRLGNDCPGLGMDCVKEWIDPHGDRATGVDLRLPPFPVAWANIYSSWNACFVGAYYRNNLDFYAKLLNPIVSGYYHTRHPGLYFWPRVVCLYVQLQYLYATRSNSEAPDDRGGGTEDWRSDLLSSLWGAVNRAAAESYQRRVEETLLLSVDEGDVGTPWTLPAGSTAALYDTKRVLASALWAQMRAMITATNVLGVAGNAAAQLFEAVKSRGARIFRDSWEGLTLP